MNDSSQTVASVKAFGGKEKEGGVARFPRLEPVNQRGHRALALNDPCFWGRGEGGESHPYEEETTNTKGGSETIKGETRENRLL